MAPIFKGGSSTMEQALDLARRGEFARASEMFSEASRKLAKEGAVFEASLARAYADLLSPAVINGDPRALMALSSFLRSAAGSAQLRPGPRAIAAADLATQLELEARFKGLTSAAYSRTEDPQGVALGLQALAGEYGKLGSEVLYIPELFTQQAILASSLVPGLMALSFETLGRSKEGTDPLAAAEHFQTAQQFWAQAGNSAGADADAARVARLALQAKCWFCGREGTGHGIQFVSLPIDQDVVGLKGIDSSPLPSLDRSGRNVFVCKGCFSAVGGLADRIAIQRAGEAELRLLSRIQVIETRLSQISSSRTGR